MTCPRALTSFCWVFSAALCGLALPTAHAQVSAPGAAAPQGVLTRPPSIARAVEPVYPEAAKAARLTGDVTLQVDIGADGAVTDARILEGAGPGFDAAALAAVRQFVFVPAEIDHVPAAVQIAYTLHFAYTDPPPPPPSAPPSPPPVT
ncbi:MAG TPA: energy transducer TonB, partial [Myxococcota bacterium]|nr:energy transducer TonB [Myxococcota bacterium]